MKKLMIFLFVCLLLGSQVYVKNIFIFVINLEGDKDKLIFIYLEGIIYEVFNDVQKKQEFVEQFGKVKIFKGKGLILFVYLSYWLDKVDCILVKGDQLYVFEDVKVVQEFGYDIGWQEGVIKKNSYE